MSPVHNAMIERLLEQAITLAELVEPEPGTELELAALTPEERRRAHVMTTAISLLGAAAIRLCNRSTEPLQAMDILIDGMQQTRSMMSRRRAPGGGARG